MQKENMLQSNGKEEYMLQRKASDSQIEKKNIYYKEKLATATTFNAPPLITKRKIMEGQTILYQLPNEKQNSSS
jgi:hypothetical protein